MKNRNLFTGWRQVFKFTAEQNIKGKGFKVATIGIFLFVAVLFAAINCIFAVVQLEDEDENQSGVVELQDSSIKKINFICGDVTDKDFVVSVIENTKSNVKGIEIADASEDIKDKKITHQEGSIVMEAVEEENVLKFNFYVSEAADVKQGDIEEFAGQFMAAVDNTKYLMAGLTQEQIAMINYSEMGIIECVDVDELENEKELSVVIMEMIVPMIFSLLFYFMILMYGQSVTKLVIAEKTSKLMETLLTSVKPYAIITGKVVSMAIIGISQTMLWIAGGVAGFMIGDKIAMKINPEYVNYISEIIDVTKSGSKNAFSVGTILLAILCLILGFFVYCILAGYAGAAISKIEDMANAQVIFQIPVIIGFFGSYFTSFFADNKIMLAVVRFLPITSPFVLPAEIVIGKANMLEGILSAAILAATCFVLIMLTGRTYKNKLFNR